MSNKYYDGKTSGVVESGEIRGYKWEIRVCRGSHPCAYVTIPDEHFIVESQMRDYYEVERECNINVHGGLTYMHGNEIGWDYAHSGDFTYYSLSPHEHKYTHEEIMEDVERAIESLEQADKQYQAKRKVEGLLRELGNLFIEQINQNNEEPWRVSYYESNNSVEFFLKGGSIRLNKHGEAKVSADFNFILGDKGKELFKRERLNAMEQQLKRYKEWANNAEEEINKIKNEK